MVLLLQLGEGAPFEPAPFRREVFGKHTLGFSYWVYQKVKPNTTIPNVDVLRVNVPTLKDTMFYDIGFALMCRCEPSRRLCAAP